jgi:hypothetical protein
MIDDVVLQKLVNNAQSAQMKMGYSDDQPGLYIEQNKMAGLNRMPLQLSKKKKEAKRSTQPTKRGAGEEPKRASASAKQLGTKGGPSADKRTHRIPEPVGRRTRRTEHMRESPAFCQMAIMRNSGSRKLGAEMR